MLTKVKSDTFWHVARKKLPSSDYFFTCTQHVAWSQWAKSSRQNCAWVLASQKGDIFYRPIPNCCQRLAYFQLKYNAAGLADRLDDIILIDGVDGRHFTASTFIDQVMHLAGGLLAQELIKDKTVALMAPNSPEYCVIFHAVAKAGVTITTLNPTYTPSGIHHQLKELWSRFSNNNSRDFKNSVWRHSII